MLSFRKFNKENIDDLIALITGDTWPFHGQTNPTEESVRSSFQRGFYTEDGNRTFWIFENEVVIGMIRLFDLDDPTCLFDIRLKQSHRGKGLGVLAVKWISDYVFTNFPDIIRIEGHTRSDNYAMRKTFYNAGFLKEAYHRNAWPTEGKLFDSVGYAIIKPDWEKKTHTVIDDQFAY
jgi:RimJ/RimL family protein N-acetyltransferase